MNSLQKVARKIIKQSFDIAVLTIEFFSEMEPYKEKVSELRKLETGTLGKNIADCLDRHKLSLVPKFESHDLKHVLLDYKMTAEGEIRLQAFMIGNGNLSVPSLAIFIFGALLLPDLWPTFYSDFKRGKKSTPISDWTIKKYAQSDLIILKSSLQRPELDKQPIFGMHRIAKFGAYTSISAGVFGMLFCLPFLFSSNMADLVGAGFPFLGGAILSVGGLLALVNLSKSQIDQQEVSLVNNV